MKPREIEYIVAIADCGGITRAAHVLCVSQPALSKCLRNVENQLGGELFDRNSKPLRATKLGELYLRHAREILRISTEFHRELDQMKKNSRELQLALGLQSMRTASLVPQLYVTFPTYFPGGQLSVLDGRGEDLINMLESGKIDLALMNSRSFPPNLEHLPLQNDRVLLVAAADRNIPAVHEEGEEYDLVDIARLQDQLFLLLPPRNSTYSLAKQIFSVAGITPECRSILSTHESMVNMVSLNNGIGFSYHSYVKTHQFAAPLKAYRIRQMLQPLQYSMIFRRERFSEVEIARLRKMCRKALSLEEEARKMTP